MWKFPLFLFFLNFLFGNLFAVPLQQDSCISGITSLQARYLNYNCSAGEDSVLRFCEICIARSQLQGDPAERFKAEQLKVNVLCLKGEIDKGITVARVMYEEAKKLNHSVGKALALQSIGATYMYTGQYKQAFATFSEAKPLFPDNENALLKANLTIQQLHACTELADTAGMRSHIRELKDLLKEIPPQLKDIYLFYATCYNILLYLKTDQTAEAERLLPVLTRLMPGDKKLNIWRYRILSEFYTKTGKYKEARICLDSTLQLIRVQGYTYEYRNLIYKQADLLEEAGEYKDAANNYAIGDTIANLMDMVQYTREIEDLRLAYYIDQATIENAQMRNKLLSSILICSLIGITISILLIIIARRRNRQLMLSRKKLNALRQLTADSIQSKSIFLSNMSHDLRTPLNAIVGFSDILAAGDDIDPETKQQCGDYIGQNCDLLMKLVNDILDFSTLKEARIKFDFRKCDVIALCRNVVETVTRVKQTEAVITFSSAVEKMEIETDSARLQQVLLNLLTNAAKFTKAGSIKLLLALDTKSGKAIFTVEDTGCGIPLEKQARIFQRFEKLQEKEQGVGLGLSICKLIIEHVDGEIWIDPDYTQGARFIFTHPLVQAPKGKMTKTDPNIE